MPIDAMAACGGCERVSRRGNVSAGSSEWSFVKPFQGQSNPLAKLINRTRDRRSDEIVPASPQVGEVELRDYRMHPQLSQAERDELVDQYRSGKSTYELARQFGIHRCTVVKHVERAASKYLLNSR
jgi:DNA-binding CsgD family transcriptional regulator